MVSKLLGIVALLLVLTASVPYSEPHVEAFIYYLDGAFYPPVVYLKPRDSIKIENRTAQTIVVRDSIVGGGRPVPASGFITFDACCPVRIIFTADGPDNAKLIVDWGFHTFAPAVLTSPTPRPGCDPAYPDVCIPPPPPDLNCSDIPYRGFRVFAPDPHEFDIDHDGIGCESG